MQLLLSALLGLVAACAAKPETSRPSAAEPAGTEPVVFVEAPPGPTRSTPEPSDRPPDETPSEAQHEEAKRLFQEAVQAYEAGDILAAIEKFRAAYLLAPLPAILFNIARGQEQLGDLTGACETYRRANADPLADDATRRAATEQTVKLNCP